MQFEVEYMLSDYELAHKFPVGSVHTVDYYEHRQTRPRTGRVVGYKDPMPSKYMASFPRVVFEDVSD